MGWIVGPTDQGPRSAPTNMVAQAPTTRSMDLIFHRWPTRAPSISNDKQKSPTVKNMETVYQSEKKMISSSSISNKRRKSQNSESKKGERKSNKTVNLERERIDLAVFPRAVESTVNQRREREGRKMHMGRGFIKRF